MRAAAPNRGLYRSRPSPLASNPRMCSRAREGLLPDLGPSAAAPSDPAAPPLCAGCASPCVWTTEQRAGIPRRVPLSSYRPRGFRSYVLRTAFVLLSGYARGWACDECGQPGSAGGPRWCCVDCRHDLCAACRSPPPGVAASRTLPPAPAPARGRRQFVAVAKWRRVGIIPQPCLVSPFVACWRGHRHTAKNEAFFPLRAEAGRGIEL
jgi:hypothetical protein